MATLRLIATGIAMMLFFVSGVAQNGEWLNLTNSDKVMAINTDGDNLWVASRGGGLCKIELATGEKTFYNKGTSAMPSNNIEAIAIDAQNNIWIGTYDQGLVKFDGQNWEHFNSQNSDLPRNDIYDLKFDSDGNLWIGSLFGITKYDGTNFTTYTIPAYTAATTLLVLAPDDIYMAWFENSFKGEIWHFDGTNMDTINGFEPSGIYKLYSDSEQRIWACYNGGIALKDGNSWILYDSTNSAIPNTQTRSLTELNGSLLLGTDSGSYTFNGTTWVASTINKTNISYLLTVNNTLYIGTSTDGLFKSVGNNVEHIATSKYNIPSNTFRRGLKDNNGKLLLRSSYPSELYTYFDNTWELPVDVQNIPNNSFFAVGPDNSYWFCGYDSLYRYDGVSIQSWNLADNGVATSISAFEVAPNGMVYIGSYSNGFSAFDGTHWASYNRGNSNISSNSIRSFAFFDGNVWIGTSVELLQQVEYGGGIEVFNGSTFNRLHPGNSDVMGKYITHMAVYGDSLWIGGDGGFALYYNGTFTNYLYNNGSGSPITYTHNLLVAPNGDVFVTGYNLNSDPVMLKFDGSNYQFFDGTNSPIVNYAYGLSDMVFDNDNNLWLLNTDGVFVYKEGGVTNINEAVVGIKPTNPLLGVTVYPNPANDYLIIELPEQDASITVYNAMGMEVLSIPHAELTNTINTSNWSQGIYYYRINSSVGRKNGIVIID